MQIPRRVVWSEGLLMSPQHLQQADLHHERFVDARFEAANGAIWGVAELAVDEAALAAGDFALTKFVGVLPDGTPVAFDRRAGEALDAPPARAVEAHFEAEQRHLAVYLALPREHAGRLSYQSQRSEDLVRHRVTTRNVHDLAEGSGHSVAVDLAVQNVRILFGYESTDDFAAIKIAEVHRLSNGRLALDQTYVPPALNLRASPFILAGVERTHSALVAKYWALAKELSVAEGAHVDIQARDLSRFLQLSAIGANIPATRYLAQAEHVSVAQAYLILAQLAGQLMAFQGDRDPAELPPLLRMDLRRTFGSLFDVISELVSATVRTDYIALDLALAPGGARGTKLTDEVARCRRFIIGVHSPGQDDESLALNLPRYTKVAASDQIERLKTASVTGVRMIHRPRVPEIPTQPGMVLFQLETTDDVWQSVLASRSLSLFIPKPYDQGSSTTIRLLAIP